LLRLNPKDFEAHIHLAILLAGDYFKDYEKAKQHYEEALRLNPNYFGTHYLLADLLADDFFKDYEGAKQHYEEALRLNPNDKEDLH
jgi:tetratricopeptide (TPR) repeat protein